MHAGCFPVKFSLQLCAGVEDFPSVPLGQCSGSHLASDHPSTFFLPPVSSDTWECVSGLDFSCSISPQQAAPTPPTPLTWEVCLHSPPWESDHAASTSIVSGTFEAGVSRTGFPASFSPLMRLTFFFQLTHYPMKLPFLQLVLSGPGG